MTFATSSADIVPITVVAAVGLVAAIIDVRMYKVHNLLTIPLAVSGLLFHAITGGVAGLGFSLVGLLIGFASLIVFYALGGVGAGDVKLMTGVGAWLGGWLTINVIVMAGIAAGLYSLVLILSCGGVRHVITNLFILVYRVRAMAVHFGQDERVEMVVANATDRHRRLVPFAAMVLMGIMGVIFGANSVLFP
jgi:prepilin peptidase CpaA